MKKHFTAALISAMALITAPATAKDREPRTWQATRTTDPVTGVSRCVVSALDYVGKTRYSRTGFLYPVIEKHPQHGLLVGVSSGGRFRLPTGTILWRVDDQPFREVRPEDGPMTADMSSALPSAVMGQDPVAAKAVADAMAVSGRMIMSATATSSFAMGDTARAMLAAPALPSIAPSSLAHNGRPSFRALTVLVPSFWTKHSSRYDSFSEILSRICARRSR